jgi:hypothetical protein
MKRSKTEMQSSQTSQLARELDCDEPYLILVAHEPDTCLTILPNHQVGLSQYQPENYASQQWTMTDDGRIHSTHSFDQVLEIRNNTFRVNTVQTMTNKEEDDIFNQEFEARFVAEEVSVNKLVCLPSNRKMIIGRSGRHPEKLALHVKNDNSVEKHQWVFKYAKEQVTEPEPMEIEVVQPVQLKQEEQNVVTVKLEEVISDDEDITSDRQLLSSGSPPKQVKKHYPELSIIPRLHSPWHIICLLLNVIIPGLGTVVGASMSESKGIRNTGYLCGMLQFLTSFLFIGWVWSVVWGVLIFTRGITDNSEVTSLLNKDW